MAKTAAQQQQLLVAARKGDKETTLRLLVEDGVYINCKDTLGFTPLMWATYYNHAEVTELLLSYVANLNAKSSGGHSPLHIAVSKGSVECVKLLCNAGANLNARAKNGYTPLHEASCGGKIGTAQILLEHKSSVNIKSNDNLTPLHLAASEGDADFCQLLLTHGAAMEFTDGMGRTPLHLAAIHPKGKEVVDLLLSRGAHAMKRCMRNLTPLQHALEINNAIVIPSLQNAELRYRNPESKTGEVIEIKGEGDSTRALPNRGSVASYIAGPTYANSTNSINSPNYENYPPVYNPNVINQHRLVYRSEHRENPGLSRQGSASSANLYFDGEVSEDDLVMVDVEAIVSARLEEAKKALEVEIEKKMKQKMELKLAYRDKTIEQLRLEKDIIENQTNQKNQQFSQEISNLQELVQIYQHQIEIEKKNAKMDVEATQKKMDQLALELQQQIFKQHEQMEALVESRVCKICFERPVNMVLFPCSHCCLCRECTVAVVKKNKKCPICRTNIERSTVCYFN